MRQNWFKVSILALMIVALVYFGAINMYSYRYDESGVLRINKLTHEIKRFNYEKTQREWFELEKSPE